MKGERQKEGSSPVIQCLIFCSMAGQSTVQSCTICGLASQWSNCNFDAPSKPLARMIMAQVINKEIVTLRHIVIQELTWVINLSLI